MQVNVQIDARRLMRAADRTSKAFQETHRMLEVVARGFRDYVRNTINSQDGGNWAKVSKWTRAKKNTNRPLARQAQNIRHIFASRDQAMVVYQGVSKETGRNISITEHHFGKVLAPNKGLVRINIKNPAPLRLPTGVTQMYFRWVNPSRIPARKIWPDRPGEATGIATPIASKWITKTAARTWK